VIGAGLMGRGIAYLFAAGGYDVRVQDPAGDDAQPSTTWSSRVLVRGLVYSGRWSKQIWREPRDAVAKSGDRGSDLYRATPCRQSFRPHLPISPYSNGLTRAGQ
jgi:3-hydroxyacyl-CoA dehydrogenase